jgi:NADPH:quinone reductase-like Zn-dependent oxidoreductase
MKTWRILDHGSFDNLVLEDAPDPLCGDDQVVVRVRAVSLNFRDLLMVLGPPPYGPRPGIVPTSDGAGEVIEIGRNVDAVGLGDRVVIPFRPAWLGGPLQGTEMASDLGGAVDGVLCERFAIAAEAIVPIPDTMTFEEAACLPCAGVTAWTALDRGKPLQPGDAVLVLGTGGVSLLGLQIAKAKGCRVIATTSSPAKAARLRELGADEVIDTAICADWEKEVLRLTGGRGVDRVIEVGGAGTLPRSIACTAPEGEIALIGLLDNPGNLISPMGIMRGMQVIRGISVGSRADLIGLVDLAARNFHPVIDSIWPFEQARDAMLHLQSQQHVGKVVIRVG